MKAYLKNYRQSPRKARLVANFVRGKKVDRVLAELEFLPNKAGHQILKLIKSAVAGAVNNFKMNKDNLYVKEITVNKGVTLKRHRPVSRGRAHPIKKRSSNISVLVAEK